MKDAKILLVTNMNKGDSVMYQIKVNGILLPQIYWSMREAMEACYIEKKRGCAVVTEIVPLYAN